MEPQTDLFSSEIKIDTVAKAHIRSLASWAMVIVVVTVFSYVLNIIQLIISPGDEPAPIQSEGFTAVFLSGQKNVGGTVITILIGLVINYFLYRFASTVNSSMNGLSQEKFSNSLRNLKIYFAITTVFMILVMLFLLIVVSVLL